MKNKKLGLDPAFPFLELDTMGNPLVEHLGISKRLYLAGMAIQGLLASGVLDYHNYESNGKTAKKAFALADELLKQENEND